MEPGVGIRPHLLPDADDGLSSTHSSPSFRMASPTVPRFDDTSYDTSVASAPPKPGAGGGLETDVESESEEEPTAAPKLAGRMQPRPAPAATERLSLSPRRSQHVPSPGTQRTRRSPPHTPTKALFLLSDEDSLSRSASESPLSPGTAARRARMQRLRQLALQRHTEAPSEPSEAVADAPPRARSSPPASDVESDASVDLPARAPAQPRGLSSKEQRSMHSMTARLRREHRKGIQSTEPKRYQLTELLSKIEHTATAPKPDAMHSSDPVESSSTPERTRAATPTHHDALRQRKLEWIQRMPPPAPADSDEDELVVVALGPRAPRIRFRTSPRDKSRAAADAQLAHLDVHPRTPRRQRITTNEYRSPSATAPTPPPLSDRTMGAAAHEFAPAERHAAGTLPTSPRAAVDTAAEPLVVGLPELNATVLQKVQAQNAAAAARRGRERRLRHDPALLDTLADADAAPPRSQADSALVRSSPSGDEAPPSSQTDGAVPSHESSPATEHSAHESSEKENVPLSATSPAPSPLSASLFGAAPRASVPLAEVPLGAELDLHEPSAGDADLGTFFVPTPSARNERATPARTPSDSSVLAQFFDHPTQEEPRGASLDIFANEHRTGPVGGMTQFFEATQARSRSQEAMPPPTHARSGDGFAALRRAQQADAAAPLSPEVLPSLDPSLAARGEALWREAQRADDATVYLNEDGFFTQTKPREASASIAESDEGETSDHEAPVARRRAEPAFVYGEAEESDDEADGGLGGVFSDHGSDEEHSSDDDDLESLLDDEREADEQDKDEAVHQRYLQQREADDAAVQALHERATKGLLRARRRGHDDSVLAGLLDDDADEDELRRRIQAPHFREKRRRVDGDGLDALAARDDAQAFVHVYNETHAGGREDSARYDFLDPGDSDSGDDTRVSAHAVRAELLRRSREAPQRPPSPHAPSEDDGVILSKLRTRRAHVPERPRAADEDHHERLLFHAGKFDVAALSRDQQQRRKRLLDEYSHEPLWCDERGGRAGLDRRRSSQAKRIASAPAASDAPCTAAPSVLNSRVLSRGAQFADTP